MACSAMTAGGPAATALAGRFAAGGGTARKMGRGADWRDNGVTRLRFSRWHVIAVGVAILAWAIWQMVLA